MAGPPNALSQRIADTAVHDGLNVYAPFPVVRLTLDGDHTVIDPAEVAALATDLQRRAGADLPAPPPARDAVYAYADERVGIAAGELAVQLLAGAPCDLQAFLAGAAHRQPLIQEAAVIAAAQARGIPVFRVRRRVIQLGHGRLQQRMRGSQTSHTSAIASKLAKNKQDTNRVLRRVGLPVVAQEVVESEHEAVRAAERIGPPVVVKPTKGNLGRGASIELTRPAEVVDAFARAARYGSVLVQRFIPGSDHRMLVVDGRLVAVARRVPAHVVGDGRQSIEALVHEANRDPRRGRGHSSVLSELRLDERTDRVLTQRGYDLATVPPAGEVVALCDVANVSAGGIAVDVTDEVHPDNRAMAVRAAKAVGLDVVGVDFLTPDIGRSYREVGGAICELNANPELRMHLWPGEGASRDVIGPVLDTLFAPGAPSRIPVAAISARDRKKPVTRLVAHLLQAAGLSVGLAERDGVLLDGELVREGPLTATTAARAVVLDPTVDAAVLATSPARILAGGLGLDACDVAAVLDVTEPDDLRPGLDRDRLDAAQRLLLETAATLAVVDADDPRCLELLPADPAGRVCLVTTRPGHPRVRDHVAAGGCAVVLEEGEDGPVVLHDGGAVVARLPLPALEGAPAGGRALAAIAVAYGMGVAAPDLERGLRGPVPSGHS